MISKKGLIVSMENSRSQPQFNIKDSLKIYFPEQYDASEGQLLFLSEEAKRQDLHHISHSPSEGHDDNGDFSGIDENVTA